MERQATARGAGAVGKKAILPQIVQKIVQQDSTISKILDFGCGPLRQHVKLLQTKLGPKFDIQGYDLGENPEILKKKWDLVYASNVINVQMTKEQLFETLQELWTAQNDGRLVVNYPQGPRKLKMNITEMQQVIESVGWKVKKINIPNKSTIVWELIKNKSNYNTKIKNSKDNNMTEEISKSQIDQIQENLNEIKDLLYKYLEKKQNKSKKPSMYNKFVGKCRKEGKSMKECGQEWKGLKESGQKPESEEDL